MQPSGTGRAGATCSGAILKAALRYWQGWSVRGWKAAPISKISFDRKTAYGSFVSCGCLKIAESELPEYPD
jgi:hypothetical protein